MKINFHRVLLGFFENWDKSSQKKWDKGGFIRVLTMNLPGDMSNTFVKFRLNWLTELPASAASISSGNSSVK